MHDQICEMETSIEALEEEVSQLHAAEALQSGKKSAVSCEVPNDVLNGDIHILRQAEACYGKRCQEAAGLLASAALRGQEAAAAQLEIANAAFASLAEIDYIARPDIQRQFEILLYCRYEDDILFLIDGTSGSRVQCLSHFKRLAGDFKCEVEMPTMDA